MLKRSLAGVCLWLAAACAVRRAAAQVRPDFRQTIDSLRDAMEIRGVSVAIFRDGAVETVVAGEAMAGTGVTRETAFQVGSVTKTFTAALALQLAGSSAFVLDAALGRWYPDLPNASRATIRQVLNHTSGIDDVFQQQGFTVGLFMNPAKRWTPGEIVARAGPPQFEPGSGWAYSSTGYVALGAILEAESGATLVDLYRTRLFVPLGLTRTYLGGFEDVAPPVAHGFVDVNGDGTPQDLSAMVPAEGFLTAVSAAGAIVSTADDLARWMYALGTGAVVPDTLWREMTTWVDRPDGNRHGLGLLRIELEGIELIGHRGNSAGFSAAAWYVPSRDAAVAVLTNKNGIAVTPIVLVALRHAGIPTEGGQVR